MPSAKLVAVIPDGLTFVKNGEDDELARVAPLLELVPGWHNFLKLTPPDEIDMIHRHERTGRPLGEKGFIEKLEIALDRGLKPQKPGGACKIRNV